MDVDKVLPFARLDNICHMERWKTYAVMMTNATCYDGKRNTLRSPMQRAVFGNAAAYVYKNSVLSSKR